MDNDPKALSLKAVRHYWRRDDEMKTIAVQLAAREGNTPLEIANAVDTSLKRVEKLIATPVNSSQSLASESA